MGKDGEAVDWRTQVVEAVDSWIGVTPRQPQGPLKPTRIATARFWGERGRYTVDLRAEHSVNLDALDRLQLRGARGTYTVLRASRLGDVLELVVAPHVTEPELSLFALRRPPGLLIHNLRQRLEQLRDPGLADRLARGGLTAPPAPDSSHLYGAQRQAYTACLRPGLYLVWGPPGTGKTRVLAQAIDVHLRRGGRVLLLSGTNVAVDNALWEAMKLQGVGLEAGKMVRVGIPHLSEVAVDARVNLDLLARQAHHGLEQQLRQIEDELRSRADAARWFVEKEAELADFDHLAYLAARDRIQREETIAALAAQLLEWRTHHIAREKAEASAVEALRALDERWAASEAPRALLAAVRENEGYLLRLEDALRDCRARHDELEGMAQAARLQLLRPTRGLHARITGWSKRIRLRARARQLQSEAFEAERLSSRASARLAAEHQRLEPKISELRRRAAPITDDALTTLQVERERARQLRDEARRALLASEDSLTQVRSALSDSEGGPRATQADRALVTAAEAAGLPALHEELEHARGQLAADRDRIAELEHDHEARLRQIHELVEAGESELIKGASLVATTLARFRLVDAVYEGVYDAVLIDEVSAAALPELLLAVARAKSTAVLFGDFLQLGPVFTEETSLLRLSSDEVERWLLTDVFAHCGVHSVDDAMQGKKRVIALDVQHRFGPAIMDLANTASYGGLLRMQAEVQLRRRKDEAEIVLIDSEGTADLGTVRSDTGTGGWWPLGALLARALAQHHVAAGESVGILTPYRAQESATLEAVRDASLDGATVTVGTVHQVQGREFPVVIFDTVEDGPRPRWVGKGRWASGERFERSGARLFNVATTRAQHRLYIICNADAVRAAAAGTVFASLRAMLDQGRIDIVRVDEILPSRERPKIPSDDPIVEELQGVFREYVRAVAVHDEHSTFVALHELVAGASHSIWIWAPWTANRLRHVLPLLGAAVGRNVRVTVFVRSDSDNLMRRPPSQRWVRQLQATVPRTVRIVDMHQKIVVVDDSITMMGSCNVLSQAEAATREMMTVFEGTHFAKWVLRQEHAEKFGSPPSCPRCGTGSVEVERSRSKQRGYPWMWRCPQMGCKHRWEVEGLRSTPGLS